MDLVSALQVLLRRWYVALPLLLLTAGATFAAWTLVTPSYEAKGSLLLRPPAPSTDAQFVESNPYLLYNNLQIPARVTQDVLLQRSELEALQGAGATGSFEVFLDPTGSTPLVSFTAVGATEAEAVTTADLAMTRFDELLVARQVDQGSPEDRLITTETVAGAAPSATLLGSRIRGAGAAMALGVIVTVTAAFLVEAASRRRAGPPPPEGADTGADDRDDPDEPRVGTDGARHETPDPGPPPTGERRAGRVERTDQPRRRRQEQEDNPFPGPGRSGLPPSELARPTSSRS